MRPEKKTCVSTWQCGPGEAHHMIFAAENVNRVSTELPTPVAFGAAKDTTILKGSMQQGGK